jgi:hypothetical protein
VEADRTGLEDADAPSLSTCSVRRDLVAELDRAADEDVCAEARPVDEGAEQPRPRELLEVRAGLGEASTDALDRTDPETASDEGIHIDAARHDVPSRGFP